jgi:translation initiation factor IF-3
MVTPINLNLRCNEQIRATPVRLIGENNEQLGILPNYEALRIAREAGLDLVEVAPNVRPPVCRLINYGKWKYTQKKHLKKHHEQQVKEVRLRPKTDTHDREIKVRQAIRFFKRGDKVQFTMVFRGRERLRREIALDIFRLILDELGPKVRVERPPSMDGRHMVMILSAAKDAFAGDQAAVGPACKSPAPGPAGNEFASRPAAGPMSPPTDPIPAPLPTAAPIEG